jgi:hypothetical protein
LLADAAEQGVKIVKVSAIAICTRQLWLFAAQFSFLPMTSLYDVSKPSNMMMRGNIMKTYNYCGQAKRAKGVRFCRFG